MLCKMTVYLVCCTAECCVYRRSRQAAAAMEKAPGAVVKREVAFPLLGT